MLPGMPDYTVFLTTVGDTLQNLGLATWFNALGGIAIFSAIVWSTFLYLTGNALGAKNTFVRAMIALALYTSFNTASGREILVQMGSAWTAAHRAVANATVRPVATQVGNALNQLSAMVATTLGVVGGTLLGATFVGAGAVMGIKGAQVALEKGAQVAKWLGNQFKSGAGRTAVFQTVRGTSRAVSFLTLALVVPYTAAVMLGGLMALVALAVMPLGAAFWAWGSNRVLLAALAVYLNGLLLGMVAPVVFAATVRTAQNTSIGQIYRQLSQLEAQARAENQRMANAVRAVLEEVDRTVQAPPDPPPNDTRNFLQRLRDDINNFGQNLWDWGAQVFSSVNNVLNNAATFIVNGLLSIFLWFVTLGALLYANLVIMRSVGGALRL